MKKITETKEKRCPQCGKITNQIKRGYNGSGTQRCMCKECGIRYTVLRRRSRCFPRKLETLQAVLKLFAEAYNAFGMAKMKFRQNRDPKSRELPFSVLDFL